MFFIRVIHEWVTLFAQLQLMKYISSPLNYSSKMVMLIRCTADFSIQRL